MVTIPLTTPVGQLSLRRTIEESYHFLTPVTATHFRIKEVLVNPDRSFSIPVYGIGERSPRKFTITLPLADFADLADDAFLDYLSRAFVRDMPADVRRYCDQAEILDPIAVSLGLPTKVELWATPAAEGAV